MFKGWNIEWHSAAAQCVELQMHAGHANSVFTNSAWIHDNIFCCNSRFLQSLIIHINKLDSELLHIELY